MTRWIPTFLIVIGLLAIGFAEEWWSVVVERGTGEMYTGPATNKVYGVITNFYTGGGTLGTPTHGIFGITGEGHITLLDPMLALESGFWRIQSNGYVTFKTNFIFDAFWTTNVSGNITLKEF